MRKAESSHQYNVADNKAEIKGLGHGSRAGSYGLRLSVLATMKALVSFKDFRG